MSIHYTTIRIGIARREADYWTREANKARLKLDFATDPQDIAYWQFKIDTAEIQAERWCANVAQMEAEHAEAT